MINKRPFLFNFSCGQITLAIVALFSVVAASCGYGAVVGSKHQAGISWFLHDSPPRLVRYDTATQGWLTDIVLPVARGTGSAFHVDADGIYVAYGLAVYRYNLTGGAETHLVNATSSVSALHTDGNLLFVNHSSSLYANFISINKTTNTQISTFSNYVDSVMGSSIAVSGNKIFGRTTGVSPSDITYVSYTDAGTFGGGGGSPYHGDYPGAAKTWVFPNDAKVVDDSGTVYSTGDLSYLGSFGGSFTDLAFSGADIPILLRNSELASFTSTLLPAGSKTLAYAPFGITVTGSHVVTYTVDATEASGIKARHVALTELSAPTPGQPVSAAGLAFTPDHVFQDVNGIVHLFHKGSQSIFRWDPATQKYLSTIPLIGIPSYVAYSPPLHRVYLAYPTGLIRRINLSDANLPEEPFYTLPAPATGLACAGTYLFANDGSGAWNTHYTVSQTGVLVDSVDWNYYSQSYVWSEANQKMYFFRDDTSPNDIIWEEINANGTAYPGEVAGGIRNKQDSPYHGDDAFIHPIRVSPNGSSVITGTGKLYNGATLVRENTLPNAINDAAWLNGELRTVRTITGVSQYQQWTGATYAAGLVKQYPGAAHRLINNGSSTTQLISISIPTDGRPSFYVLDSSFEVVSPASLDKPGFLTLTSLSATQAAFSWADVSGETSYSIERKTGSGGTWTAVGTCTVSNTTFTDAAVTLGNDYYYRVIARNGALASPASDELYAPVTAPPVPSGLAANATSSSAINVTWTDGDRETGYKLEYAMDGAGPWTTISTRPANTVSYSLTSLSQSTTYYFRIRSSNAIGDSAYSAVVSATTSAAPPSSSYLYASAAAYNRVSLSWSDVAFEQNYVIERAPYGTTNWAALTTLAANTTSYSDTTVSGSTNYSYRIKAVNAAGSSNWSTASVATPAPTPPAVPGNVTLQIVSASNLRLTWSNVADETGYQIERRTDDPQSWSLIATVAADTTAYNDLTVTGGLQYWYRVKSINIYGASAASTIVTGTPMTIYTIAQDDFDPTPESSLWASISSGVATNGGAGFLSGNALWFGASGIRSATTRPQNFLQAGYVEFSFRAGNQSVDGDTYWNNSESGEGVVLEYSLDGTTWISIQSISTLHPNNSTWTNYYVAVPQAAQTATTQLRWRQLAHSGGTTDAWALENVTLYSAIPGILEMPEIDVVEAAVSLSSGASTVNFGGIVEGGQIKRTFKIRNAGSAALSGIAVSITGAHASNFNAANVATSLAAGAEASFDVTFSSASLGSRSAELRIASNDTDENPFIINLAGYVSTTAQIVVESPDGTVLSSNVSVIDFGNVLTGGRYYQTVTIRNSGTSRLTDLAVTILYSGLSSFGLQGLSVTSLDPGASTSFQTSYQPISAGPLSATLRITSSDVDDSPFDISLQGTARDPQAASFDAPTKARLALLGSRVQFSPVIHGETPMTFQWRKGGEDVSGARQSSLILATTSAADIGSYSVEADNQYGPPAFSNPVYLGLVTPMAGAQTIRKGGGMTLRCSATAPSGVGISLQYSWRRDGVPLVNGTQPSGAVIKGASDATFSISKVDEQDSGGYECQVKLLVPGAEDTLSNGEMVVHIVSEVPEVNPVAVSTLFVSQSVDTLVTATNFPTAFSASGLPRGLTLDPKSGRLTGKPLVPSKRDENGDYVPSIVTFKAANPAGTGPGLLVPMVVEELDPGSTGTFYGFVARSAHSNFGLGGHVQITVAPTGVVTGAATLAGQRHSVTGVLDVMPEKDPEATLQIKRSPASLGNLALEIKLYPNERLIRAAIQDPQLKLQESTDFYGDPANAGLVNGMLESAKFSSPTAIVTRPDGKVCIADRGNHCIRLLDLSSNTVSTIAGSTVPGAANGQGTTASFNSPEGLAVDANGNLYVADTGNSIIRRITPEGVVSTIAGLSGQVGSTNGLSGDARFNQPAALCLDGAGNLYIVDRGNHCIRRMTPLGVVTTFAGKAGTSGHKDGSGATSLFNTPQGAAFDPVLKSILVTDSGNQVIRRISLSGSVSTFAGSPGVSGLDDGLLTSARFDSPRGIISLGNGTLIVTDTVLRQITANGIVGSVSERIDPLDHLVAVCAIPSDGRLIAVHDLLHGVSIHEAGAPSQNATFTARACPWSNKSPVPVAEVGVYNATLENDASDDEFLPQGSAYAQVSISKAGAASWVGRAADGTSFTFSTFMSADYIIPLHVMLYKNTGSLQGECFVDSASLTILSQDDPGMDWYKVGQPLASKDRSYKAGFNSHSLMLSGRKYRPNDIYNFLGLEGSSEDMQLSFSSTRITEFQQGFVLADPNTVTVPSNPLGLVMKVDPKTGIFTGSFKATDPEVPVTFSGIITGTEVHSGSGQASVGRGYYLIPDSDASTSAVYSGRVDVNQVTTP